MRPRREIPGWLFLLARPFFRHSRTRHAYVLRLVGRTTGPVIRRRGAPVPEAPAPVEPVTRTGRFARDGSTARRSSEPVGSGR